MLLTGSVMTGIHAQIKKDVYVTRDFQPVLSDEQKIDEIPTITEKLDLVPPPEYSVIPGTVQSNFRVKSIKAAKMVGTPLDKLYKSYIKVGIGNYWTPLVEYSIHNLRSQDYAVGAVVRHKSSRANLRLDNDDDVPAGYSSNELGVYGKKFYNNLNLEGELFYNTQGIRHYGYNTAYFMDSVPDISTGDIRQNYRTISGKLRLLSTATDKKALDYELTVKGKHFWDRFDNKLSEIDLGAGLGYNISDFNIIAGIEYKLVGAETQGDHHAENLLKVWPRIRKQTDEWQVELGAKIYHFNNDGSNTYFYPQAELQFHVVKGILTPYVGIDGDFMYSNYSRVINENPYIQPGLDVQSTNMKLNGYGGIMGAISRNLKYRLDISFASLEDVYFFVNDSIGLLQNEFLVDYYDVDRTRYFAELNYEPLHNLSLWAKVHVYSYSLSPVGEPWHKPKYELTFTTRYNLKEKVFLILDLYNIGERKAKNVETGETIILDPIVDVNLKIEYKYSNILTVFLDFYNITSEACYRWNQYPSQKLNILAGFSYKF